MNNLLGRIEYLLCYPVSNDKSNQLNINYDRLNLSLLFIAHRT